MPQSLFVIASVTVLALFGLSRQRALAADERAAIGRAVEVAALDASERWGDQVRDRAFDEADVGLDEVRVRGDVAGLSEALGPDAGEVASDPATFDDIDDYHGAVVRDSVAVGDGWVAFDVSFTAHYASAQTFAPATTPTTSKVVTLVVTEVTDGRTERTPVRMEVPIRLTSAKQTLFR